MNMNIKAQVPAEGVLLRKDYGDAKVYKIVCECGDCDHSHEVWIEADDYVTVTTFTEQKTNFWSRNRWQHIWQLLTKGYVQYEASIIMSEQQALNYAETLKSAVADVKEFKQDKK
jgi:DNA replicative helicase MCM subunit Mcm2 (Cdc46/Mcm family)